MNRVSCQTIATIRAQDNLVEWMREEMEESMTTAWELAKFCDVSEKTIYAILSGQRDPKLSLVVKIFDYFDKNWVQIPFYK